MAHKGAAAAGPSLSQNALPLRTDGRPTSGQVEGRRRTLGHPHPPDTRTPWRRPGFPWPVSPPVPGRAEERPSSEEEAPPVEGKGAHRGLTTLQQPLVPFVAVRPLPEEGHKPSQDPEHVVATTRLDAALAAQTKHQASSVGTP